MQVYHVDPCFWEVVYTCHEMGMFGLQYDDYGTIGFGDPGFTCDTTRVPGCSTFPLGNGTKNKILNILYNHINAAAECQWAIGFIQTQLANGFISHYGINDGNTGDSHGTDGDTSAMHARIHIKDQSFGTDSSLGLTLIHEAAHWHFNIDQAHDYQAEAWARQCYKP